MYSYTRACPRPTATVVPSCSHTVHPKAPLYSVKFWSLALAGRSTTEHSTITLQVAVCDPFVTMTPEHVKSIEDDHLYI